MAIDIKELHNQLDMVKTRAASIASMIQDFEVHRLNDSDEVTELLNDCEGDLNALQIHLSAAWEAMGD